MKIKLRFWNCEQKASDGSVISLPVFQEYLNSEQYKEAIESKSMLCSLTHRSRSIASAAPEYQSLKKTVGSDDLLLVVDHNTPSPVMYLDGIYYDPEIGWMCADATILEEADADEDMAKQIKRLKALLKAGCKIGCSAVIVAYWGSAGGNSGDICKCIKSIKSIDLTLNPSQSGARVTDIYEEGEEPKHNSQFNYRKLNMRSFSDTVEMRLFSADEYAPGMPKTSKIGMNFTTLKVKEFSCTSDCTVLDQPQQKEYSVSSLKERLRYNKLSPRQSFRRLMLDYKQLLKAQKGTLTPEDEKILKSLFTTDVLNILKQIHPEILKGKQISTLLGASSLGKTTRVAAQKLQIPYKLASKEVEKSGAITPTRFKKLAEAYTEFIGSLIEEIFGASGNNDEVDLGNDVFASQSGNEQEEEQ